MHTPGLVRLTVLRSLDKQLRNGPKLPSTSSSTLICMRARWQLQFLAISVVERFLTTYLKANTFKAHYSPTCFSSIRVRGHAATSPQEEEALRYLSNRDGLGLTPRRTTRRRQRFPQLSCPLKPKFEALSHVRYPILMAQL